MGKIKVTKTEGAVFYYKCTDFCHPGDEGSVAWNDPQSGVEEAGCSKK